jgi:hypothetical protein
VKVKCPTCGQRGVDRYSLPREREDEATFAIHGRMGSRAVRKCLNCGSGVFVKLLPPRYQAIPPDLWEEMQVHFENEMAAHRARWAELDAERERQFLAEQAAQPSAQEDTT